jgi:hypothetical protein
MNYLVFAILFRISLFTKGCHVRVLSAKFNFYNEMSDLLLAKGSRKAFKWFDRKAQKAAQRCYELEADMNTLNMLLETLV